MSGNIYFCLVSKIAFHNKDFYRTVTLQRVIKRKYSILPQTICTISMWPDAFSKYGVHLIIQNLRPTVSEAI